MGNMHSENMEICSESVYRNITVMFQCHREEAPVCNNDFTFEHDMKTD